MKLTHFAAGLALLGTTALADASDHLFVTDAERDTYDWIHYSTGAVVGNNVYLSGVSGQPFEGEDAIERQFDDAFARLKANLEAAGSDLSHVKEVYSWHVDLWDHAEVFLKMKDKYFPGPDFPAFTSVEIEGLPPGAFLELTARAEVIDGGDTLEYRDAPGKEAATLRYTPAIVDGDMIYLSGLSGDSSGSVEDQMRSAFETLKAEVEAAGSSMDDIIEVDAFVVNPAENMALVEQMRDEYITAPVVWNPIPIKGIVDPKGLLELTVRVRPTGSDTLFEVTPGDAPNLARAIRYGNDVYIAAVLGSEGDTDTARFNHAFQQLQASVEAAGLEMSDVVEFNSYMSDQSLDRFMSLLPTKDLYLKDPYPTWNGIGVSDFGDGRTIIAMSARAVAK